MGETSHTAMLKIGALARATGVSVRAIRHYDKEGLLTASRAHNGYRQFPPQAISQVKQIQRLISTGFSLEEIRSFPDCMLLIEGAKACASMTEAQQNRLAILEQKIETLENQRQRLRAMLTESLESDRSSLG